MDAKPENLLENEAAVAGGGRASCGQGDADAPALETVCQCVGGAIVMGILNVTPDSFSDGGVHLDPEIAVDHALRMVTDGAAIVDVGPESTRPGAQPVPADEQIRRAVPVIGALHRRAPEVAISIDTTSARVAEAAIEAGATMVNDTSALRDDPDMVRVISDSGAAVVLMHRYGTPETMQLGGGPQYDDVVAEIRAFLKERFRFAIAHGVSPQKILVDPGIGFGKRTEHNLSILRHAGRFGMLGDARVPVLIGASRKRFLGEVLGIDDPRQRDAASVTAAILAVQYGARIVRVHEVRATVDALRLLNAVSGAHRNREKAAAAMRSGEHEQGGIPKAGQESVDETDAMGRFAGNRRG